MAKLQALISPEVEKRLGELVKTELIASHIYHFLAMWCDENGYFGAQSWYLKQTEEEKEHAQKVMDYIADRNGCAVMPLIPSIEVTYTNIRQVLERTLEEELKVERKWSEFAAYCCEMKDYTSFTFAQWYLNEQVHEIAVVADFLATLDMMGDSGLAFERIDKIMAV